MIVKTQQVRFATKIKKRIEGKKPSYKTWTVPSTLMYPSVCWIFMSNDAITITPYQRNIDEEREVYNMCGARCSANIDEWIAISHYHIGDICHICHICDLCGNFVFSFIVLWRFDYMVAFHPKTIKYSVLATQIRRVLINEEYRLLLLFFGGQKRTKAKISMSLEALAQMLNQIQLNYG